MERSSCKNGGIFGHAGDPTDWKEKTKGGDWRKGAQICWPSLFYSIGFFMRLLSLTGADHSPYLPFSFSFFFALLSSLDPRLPRNEAVHNPTPVFPSFLPSLSLQLTDPITLDKDGSGLLVLIRSAAQLNPLPPILFPSLLFLFRLVLSLLLLTTRRHCCAGGLALPSPPRLSFLSLGGPDRLSRPANDP